MDNNNQRFWEVMIGLFLLIFGLASLGQGGVVALILGAIGVMMLARQFNQGGFDVNSMGRSATPTYEEEDIEEPEVRQAGSEQVYSHAIQAVRRAGLEPSDIQILPVDIGVMAYRAGTEPVVYRSQPVVDNVDYIQPFVQLRLPTKAIGRIRFEILDADGEVVFIHEDRHQLERGRNLVTPTTRLPIHDAHAMQQDWELRVSADGVLLAQHKIAWQESESKIIRRQLNEDGEISNEMRAAIQDSEPGAISLDDLLSYQDEDDQQQQRRR